MTGRRALQWATAIVVGLLLGGLAFVLSLLYDAGVPLPVCLVGGFVVYAGGAALSRLPTDDVGDLAPASQPGAEQRASFGDLQTLQSRLAGVGLDAGRFEDRVRRPLADLTAERLQQRHDVDWLAEPRRARAVLDPQLWQLLAAPSGRFEPGAAQIEQWVAALERL